MTSLLDEGEGVNQENIVNSIYYEITELREFNTRIILKLEQKVFGSEAKQNHYCQLENRIKSLEEQNQTLKEERDSLLTALRLMQSEAST